MFPLKVFVTLLFAISAFGYPVVKVNDNSEELTEYQIHGITVEWIGLGPRNFTEDNRLSFTDTLNATSKDSYRFVKFVIFKKSSGEIILNITEIENFITEIENIKLVILKIVAGFLIMVCAVICVYGCYLAYKDITDMDLILSDLKRGDWLANAELSFINYIMPKLFKKEWDEMIESLGMNPFE